MNLLANRRALGVLLIIISAVGYGAQPIFGKFAYAEGVSPSALTFGRFFLAAAFFELHYLFLPQGNKMRRRELLTTAGIGAVFAGAAFCYFISLQYLSPVVFSFLYYTYPALTLLAGAAFFGDKPSARQFAAAAAAAAGMALLLGGGDKSADAAGVLWILGCSLCMAFFFHLQKFLPKKRCELYHAKVMIRTMCALFFVWWLADGLPLPDGAGGAGGGGVGGPGGGWQWIFWTGLVSTYIAFTASVAGISLLGANNAALLSGQEPLWTALFAFAAFGVWLDTLQVVGAGVMLAAVFYINRASVSVVKGG